MNWADQLSAIVTQCKDRPSFWKWLKEQGYYERAARAASRPTKENCVILNTFWQWYLKDYGIE